MQEYEGWNELKNKIVVLGTNPPYKIDGYKDKVFINRKKGSNDYDGVALYVILSKRKLILSYYRTYGI